MSFTARLRGFTNYFVSTASGASNAQADRIHQAVDLTMAARYRNLDDVLEGLALGADPTLRVNLGWGTSSTNAILESISQNQPAMLDAILDAGFRLDAYEVQKVVRQIEQQSDFDGHPGEMTECHDLVRVLFKHGERFTAPSHSPHHSAEDSQADFIRRHAPGLSDLDFSAPSVASGLGPRAPQPAARTQAEREAISLRLSVYHADLDEVRHLLDRGADPMRLSDDLNHPTTLIAIAIRSRNAPLMDLALDRGLVPSARDLQQLVTHLSYHDENRPGARPSSHQAMICSLFARGERFQAPLEDESAPEQTLAKRIRALSPRLAKELDWDSAPAPIVSAGADQDVEPRRRRRRLG